MNVKAKEFILEFATIHLAILPGVNAALVLLIKRASLVVNKKEQEMSVLQQSAT